MIERVKKVREALEQEGLSTLVVTKIENVRYLSGFSGSSAVGVVTPANVYLVTDSRYHEQAVKEAPSWELLIYTSDLAEAVASLLPHRGAIGFETSIIFEMHRKLGAALAGGASLRPVNNLIEKLRTRKDPSEIALIRASISCAGLAYEQVLPLIQPGVTERALAAEIDYRMMLAGADGPAFDTVVASGPNSSLPHAGITDRTLAEGDLVVIDFGALKNGYCSDISRTLVTGEQDTRQREVIDALKTTQQQAISSLRPGLPARDADLAAREALRKSGLEGYFTHSLGHGVGLEVHELPTLAARSEETLEASMVFTVEPGIYIEGWGGARLEEMVLLTENGPELLTGSPR